MNKSKATHTFTHSAILSCLTSNHQSNLRFNCLRVCIALISTDQRNTTGNVNLCRLHIQLFIFQEISYSALYGTNGVMHWCAKVPWHCNCDLPRRGSSRINSKWWDYGIDPPLFFFCFGTDMSCWHELESSYGWSCTMSVFPSLRLSSPFKQSSEVQTVPAGIKNQN